ncbi:hypothetical protein [Mesoplasma photuris]|uniref:hypothetical protein n=1 Tax=Mesoplasma photuris TaxID=217731 RepID=UPI0004E16B08|nr:hypothetical protein [Mesoplasma photuris]
MDINKDKNIRNWSFWITIGYGIISIVLLAFPFGWWFLIEKDEGVDIENIKTLGDFLLSIFFVWHFFFASLWISIISLIIFIFAKKEVKETTKKEYKINIILLCVLSVGFLGFIIAIPIIPLWYLLFKKVKKQNNILK